MLMPPATMVAEWLMQDKGGRKAKVTLRFPFSFTLSAVELFASSFTPLLMALSDAALISISFRWVQTDDNPAAAGTSSDVGYYLVCYYSNDVDTEPFLIPSPRSSILEATGGFAGIRLDLSNPQVAQLALTLTDALAETTGPDAQPWNRWLVAGGRTR